MSDNERRIIDYDAFNDLPPNSWLIVDSEGQGTGKIAPIKIGATYEIQDGAHSFTLVGSNGYTHTVDIPYDSVQMSYADYQALTEVQKMDGTNRFVPDVPTDDLEPEIWQRVGRTPLTTVEKTISPAINELKGRIDDSDGEIEDIKSNLTVNVSTANNITYTKEGNKRRIDLQWVTYSNVKSFFNNLSSVDKPSASYVSFVSTSVSYYYVNMALLEIGANAILCSRCSAYNNVSVSYGECSNTDLIKGSLEWYVS